MLADGTRLLTQRGVLLALGCSSAMRGGQKMTGDKVAPFMAAINLKPFIAEDLRLATTPVKFRTIGGILASGFRAELLPEICDVFLKARASGALQISQAHIALQCEVLVRSFAKVGIIALVDEATGYQDVRARDSLAKILENFVAKDLRAWVKTFPPDFYKEMFRLRNLAYPGSPVKPSYIGHLTNDVIYARLAPGVLAELRDKNPRTKEGTRTFKHRQFLTADWGHPKLREHVASVIALMRASDTWDGFKKILNRALPTFQEVLTLAGLPESDNLIDTTSSIDIL